jgi:hypothetical protein
MTEIRNRWAVMWKFNRVIVATSVVMLGVVFVILFLFLSGAQPDYEGHDLNWGERADLGPQVFERVDGPFDRKLKEFSAKYNRPKTLPYGRTVEIIFIIEGDKRGTLPICRS